MRDLAELQDDIERLYQVQGEDVAQRVEELASELRARLQRGEVRAAEPHDGGWRVNRWVKQGLLLAFRHGRPRSFPGAASASEFFDKSTVPPRRLTMDDAVRLVPGGSSIREGAYVARGVVCMPPMFVNVGAFVDEGTMIDSHALVGSCAQIGKRVHLSAGAQVGGVLEPPGAMPVVIEDDVFVGANSAVLEGTLVRRGAVLAPGTTLSRGTRLYDVPNERVLRATDTAPLTVPTRAVVVPGSRVLSGDFAAQHAIHLYAPIIVKYRDGSTDDSVALEEALRA